MSLEMFLPREAFPAIRTENHVHSSSMFSCFLAMVDCVFTPVFLEVSDRLNWDRFSGGARSSKRTRRPGLLEIQELGWGSCTIVEVTWGEAAGKSSPVDYLDLKVTQMNLSFSPILIPGGTVHAAMLMLKLSLNISRLDQPTQPMTIL